jgi:hypothetical protein
MHLHSHYLDHLSTLMIEGSLEVLMILHTFPPQIALARIVPILVSLIWLGIGIRQWFVLSKWSKKYERYKELQKRIDAKLDYGNNHVDDNRKEGQQGSMK